MRKLSLLLALAMLVSCISVPAVFATGEAIPKIYATVDFLEENGSTSNLRIGANSMITGNDDVYGSCFYNNGGTSNYFTQLAYKLPKTGDYFVTAGKYVYGMDIKLNDTVKETGRKALFGASSRYLHSDGRHIEDNNGGGVLLGMLKDNKVFLCADGTGEAAMEGSPQTTLTADVWYRIDFVLDLDSYTKSLYIDGEHIDTVTAESLSQTFEHSGRIWPKDIHAFRYVDNMAKGVSIDNFRVASIPTTQSYSATTDGDVVRLKFRDSVSGIQGLNASMVGIKNIETGASVTITAAENIGTNIVKITTSGMTRGGEYKVEFTTPVTEIYDEEKENGITAREYSDIVFNVAARTEQDKLYNFEDGVTAFVTGNTNDLLGKATVVFETGESGNRVLTNSTTNKFMGVELPFGATVAGDVLDNNTITMSYKFKRQVPTSGTPDGQLQLFLTSGKNNSVNDNWTVNPIHTVWLYGNGQIKKFYTSEENENGSHMETLTETFGNDTWYVVTQTFNYASGTNKGTFKFEMTDTSGNPVASYTSDIPEELWWRNHTTDPRNLFKGMFINNTSSNTKFMIDDVYIKREVPKASITKVRYIDEDGNEYVGGQKLPADITKIAISTDLDGASASTFDGKVVLGEATLPTGVWSGSTYTIDLGTMLGSEQTKTFAISGVTGLDNYTTTLETKPGVFEINSLKIYKTYSDNGVAADDVLATKANVAANDTLTVVAEVRNTTGGSVPCSLSYGIYNKGFLKGFDFADGYIFSTGKQNVTLGTIVVESITDLEIKAFAWDSIGGRYPYVGSASIK